VTRKFGITINSDCVIRTSFYKYFHPKEAYIHNGILNEEVTRVVNGYAKEPKGRHNNGFALGGRDDDEEEYQKESKRTGVDFVYVTGASLTVAAPANAILTSGPLTYPCNRPICGVYQHAKSGGKLVVVGSVSMFMDDYFEQEENAKLMDFFLKFFFTQEVELEWGREDNETAEYVFVPDIAEIADNLKSCFHVLPKIFRKETSCPRISPLCSRLISSSTTSISFLKSLPSSPQCRSSMNL
jgi:intraflagellar transport protein 52